MSDSLVTFGHTFQTKVIAGFVTDLVFLEQTYDIITADVFDTPARKWIVSVIKSYYPDYRACPTMEVFKIEVGKIQDEILKIAVVEQLRSVYESISATDMQFIKDKYIEFSKNQAVKNAILQSVDLLSDSNYDGIKDVITKAYHVGEDKDHGHIWKDDIDKRVSKSARQTIPTPWPIINQLMDGGLGPGEIGTIMAPSGAGKSYLLTNIGAYAAAKGKNIIHYTLELNEVYQSLRYDSYFLKVPPNEVKNHIPELQEKMKKVAGNIIVKYFSTKTASPSTLHSHLQKIIAFGFVPDLIIVDYGDLLKSDRKGDKNTYEEMGTIYEDLRRVASEAKLPLWTASQTNRSSINSEIIMADSVAESYKKIMVSDFVLTLSRTTEDKINNSARIHVTKNRFGMDGLTFPVLADFAKFIVDIYEGSSEEVESNNNIVKDMLKQRKSFQL